MRIRLGSTTSLCFKQLYLFLFAFFMTETTLANPMGGNVSAGSAVITQTPNVTTINQSSRQAIINWQSFNINKGQATHFNQPAGGITLNRINPMQGASQIYGVLTATGRIVLVNPAGIYFGPSAYVNVGGLIATTGNISDTDFLSGNYRFIQDPRFHGSIVNQGTIIAADHGLVALLGGTVDNSGHIQANLGYTVMGAGGDFSMKFAGNDLISFNVDKRSIGGVTNTGKIIANGGRVMVSASAASNVLDNIINLQGTVETRSVSKTADGTLILSGDPNGGTVRVASNINASSSTSGVRGGNVKITGYNVVVESPTTINVSGKEAEGGFVETSGRHLSIGDIQMNLGGGNWLIDPNDFTVADIGGNMSTATLLSALNTGNVKIETTQSGTGGNGDIFVNDAINWGNANSLTLSAFRHINVNNNISNTGAGNLILRSDNTGTGTGTVAFSSGVTVNLASGNVKLYYNAADYLTPSNFSSFITSPYTAYMLVNTATNLQNINTNLSGNYALGRNIDAGALAFLPLGNTTTAFSGSFDGQGYQIKNLDIHLPGSSNIGLFGVSSGRIENVGVTGKVRGNHNVGALVGNNTGILNNTYSLASVVGVGAVGGLVGLNNGSINASLAAGYVSGTSQTGGLVGSNNGTVNNSYWNNNTTGQSGGLTTTQMMSQASFSGLDFTNTWGIIEGKSYPYLKAGFNGTPRAISGTLSNTDPFSLVNTFSNANQTIKLASNSNVIDTAQTGADGFYYFLQDRTALADTFPFMVYTSDSSTKANTVTVAPGSGGSIKNLALMPNTLLLSDNGIYTAIPALFMEGTTTTTYDFMAANPNNCFTLCQPLALSLGFSPYLDRDTYLSMLPIANPNIAGSLTYLTYNFTNKAFLLHLGRFGIATADQDGLHYLPSNVNLNNLAEYDKAIQFSPVYNFLTNRSLGYALGNLTGSDFLYTTSGANVNVKDGYNVLTTEKTNFGLTGNLSTTNGHIKFDGPVQVGPLAASYNKLVRITTNITGNITTRLVVWALTTPVSSDTLKIDAADKIRLDGIILGRNDFYGANVAAGAASSLGNLILAANATTPKSITTSLTGGVVLNSFTLERGNFYQDNLIFLQTRDYGGEFGGLLATSAFAPIVSFTISPGASFVRNFGGNGTVTSPYLIGDIFGLAGIGSNDATLAAHYKVIGGELTSTTANAFPAGSNGGTGWKPIGTTAHPFTGTIDGLMNGRISSISNIGMNNPTTTEPAGIFGVISPTARISNLFLKFVSFTGNNNVGALVGYNNGGSISNIFSYNLQVLGNQNVGALVGTNNGNINNVTAQNSYANGNNNVGGLMGINLINGTVDKVLSHVYVFNRLNSAAVMGGIAALNTGTITNSFWDTDYSGQQYATSDHTTIPTVTGGCFKGQCTNGGVANLSQKLTYSTQSGYVSSGWNFANTWDLVPGNSYPYLSHVLGYTDIPGFANTSVIKRIVRLSDVSYPIAFGYYPNYFSAFAGSLGTSTLAGQPVYALSIVPLLKVPGFPDMGIYRTYSSLSFAGADGSFYLPISSSFVVNNAIGMQFTTVGYTLTGNNAVGSVISHYSGYPLQVVSTTIPLHPTINSTTPYNPRPLSVGTANAFFLGIDPATLNLQNYIGYFNIRGGVSFVGGSNNAYNQVNVTRYSNRVAAVLDLYFSGVNVPGILAQGYDTYALSDDLVNLILSMQSTENDMVALLNMQRALDIQFFKRYEVNPLTNCP